MDWTAARERLAAPIFAPLAPALAKLPADRWPTLAELSALAEGVKTSRGKPVRFVRARERNDRERRYYEQHIADTGEVETRENWHDLFNALDKLEGFASHFGADFYGLPRNKGKVTLKKEDWVVPGEYPFGTETVVPLRAGQKIGWKVAS